jgi:hypothetical protein
MWERSALRCVTPTDTLTTGKRYGYRYPHHRQTIRPAVGGVVTVTSCRPLVLGLLGRVGAYGSEDCTSGTDCRAVLPLFCSEVCDVL